MKWKRLMNFLTIIFGLILGAAVYAFMNIAGENKALEYILSACLGVLVAFITVVVSSQLDKRIGWKEHTGWRLLAGLLVHTLLALLIVLASLKAYQVLDISAVMLRLSILVFSIALIYNIVYFIFYSYHNYNVVQVQGLAFQRLQKELQLSALKSQLSPHFLFNSLNALSSLFHRNVDDAECFIRSLGKSFHYVLDKYELPLVPLKDELSFVTAYAEMMRIRFGKHLHINSELTDEALSSYVPPLTIQMLVENAVKHNKMDDANPLNVHLRVEEDYLEVSNIKNLRASVRNSTNVGLENISKRYELLQEGTVRVENSEDFVVKLPLIP